MPDLIKTHELTLTIPRPEGKSSQPREDEEALFVSRIVGSDIIEPPLDLRLLARLSQTNSARRGILEALCRNTVGLGYTIELDAGHEHDDNTEELRTRTEHTLEALARRDTRCHRPTMTELLYMVKWDEEEVGNGYLEVSRSRLTGSIDGIFYVPGARVRRLRDRDGWVLLPPDFIDTERKVIRFYNWGEKVRYDSKGVPQPKLESGRRWARNELIPFQVFTSASVDYGLPRDAGLATEYAGDKLAAETNLSFFDSSGTPPKLVFVQGEAKEGPGGQVVFTVPPDLTQKIGELIKSDGGAQKRVGIIPLPPGASTSEVELGQISDRDIGFTEYRRSIVRRQLGAFRVSPVFVGITDEGGRYTAEVERAITLEQVFDPDQRRWEDRLHDSLYHDLGVPQLRHRFKRLAVEGDATKRESAKAMGERGTITNREYRAAHGYAPLPEAEPGAEPEGNEMPHGWNDALVGTMSSTPQDEQPPPEDDGTVLDSEDTRGLRPRLAGRPVKRQDPALNGTQ